MKKDQLDYMETNNVTLDVLDHSSQHRMPNGMFDSDDDEVEDDDDVDCSVLQV